MRIMPLFAAHQDGALATAAVDGLQVGVANDVIPLFGGQTREFIGVLST